MIRYRNLGDDLVRVAFWADGILLHWIESLSVGIALQTNSGETWSPFTNQWPPAAVISSQPLNLNARSCQRKRSRLWFDASSPIHKQPMLSGKLYGMYRLQALLGPPRTAVATVP